MIHGNWGLGFSQDRADRLAEDVIEPPVAQRIEGEPVNGPSLCCIALWNLDLHTKAQVWDIMRRLCRNKMFTQIQQIRRICQKRDRKVRFEIVLPITWQGRAERRFEKAKFRFAFTWKTLVTGGDRPQRNQHVVERPQLDFITLCSLNINGVKKKVQAFREYMESRNVSAVCLQETLRKSNHWRLTLSGFGCVERPSEEVAGRRGLALGVDNDSLTAFPVGTQSSFLICERVYGSRLSQPFVLGTVYIPHRHVIENDDGPLYREACESLIRTVGNLRRKYPNDPVIVTGDFNMSRVKVDALALRMLGMRRVKHRGDAKTFHGRSQGGDIDHVLISTEHYDLVRASWVDRECDLSDHWPTLIELDMKVRGAREVIAPLPDRWQVAKGKALRKTPEKLELILNDNRFLPLAYDSTDAEAEAFIDHLNEVARDADILVAAKVKVREHTSKEHRRAAEKQRRSYIEYKATQITGSEEEILAAFQDYVTHRKATKVIIRSSTRANWVRSVAQADSDFVANQKVAWTWISTTAGWRRKGGSLGIQPILDQDGNLCTAPEVINAAWTAHYRRLAEDVIGFSQNQEHWERIIPDVPNEAKLPANDKFALNAAISVEEVVATLKRLKSWKAPGCDRIPVDFLKLFACGAEGNAAVRALTRICNRMFVGGSIPEVWTKAVVVSIFKKGDPTECGNFRGISLMDSTLKVLLTVLTTRLQAGLEANGMVVREQAGFRPREECMTQVMALYEVLRRRFLNKQDTFVLFLDFQKAYDVVPHHALFRRLEVLGVDGRFLDFLKVLYRDSRIAIRQTDGSPGEPFALERGLRQGCPLSPILFTVFINTIFDGDEDLGCSIPGLAEKISGLMFADDTVGLAATAEDLLKIKQRVCEWSDRNGMTFGVTKCATMAFLWDDPNTMNSEIFSDHTKWHIDNVPIPTPEEYVYLGIKFNLKLLHEKDDMMREMVGSQIRKGQQALADLTPFLSCSSVPQTIKRAVVRCVIEAKMLWGAELWGMSCKRVEMAQTVMNNAMRLILGVRGPKSFMPVACMMKELKMEPIWALVASRRMRAYYKFPKLNTWAAALVRHLPTLPPGEARRTWVTQTEWWIQRMNVTLKSGEVLKASRVGLDAEGVDEAVKATKAACTERWINRKANKTGSCSAYSEANYKPFLGKDNTFPPDFGRGLCVIQQLRCNGYWTGDRLSKIEPQPRGCVFCNSRVPETIGHMLVECPAWTEFRERYIAEDLRIWRGHLVDDESLAKVAVVALGGTVDGYSASHYYPKKDTYTFEDAVAGRVKDPPAPEPGPVDYTPMQQRDRDRPPTPEWQWPTGRPLTPPPVEVVIEPERAPDTPEWQWPTGRGDQGSPDLGAGVPWVHRVNPDQEYFEDQPLGLNRELRREMEWADKADQYKPFWGRCSMLGMAAFLTRVDHGRAERRKELKLADQAELQDVGLGQDGHG